MAAIGQRQRCASTIPCLGAGGTLAQWAIFASAAFGTLPAQAQTYTVLHRFTGLDGVNPDGLTGDRAGNLWGTTYSGGASDAGTVFKADKTGLTVLYSFTGAADGRYPFAGVELGD